MSFIRNVFGERGRLYKNLLISLRDSYKSKLLPLETAYKFDEFHSEPLSDKDFEAKPMVLLLGQYSTGKSTFIRHLLQQDFPGLRIGPEPTTDRFIAIMGHDNVQDDIIPGNALVVDPRKQFGPLARYGNAFLNKMQCSLIKNPVLDYMTFIDTPGILSGEKQRIDRGYDFASVLEWFAERVDRVLLLFDAHKLDISDEFKRVIEGVRGHEEKVRIILNKADAIEHQQLMRVYGALMWSLGKVFHTPEVSRVYIGSFWDEPLRSETYRKLFEMEERDLMLDLQSLPRFGALRKINDLIKRARLAQVHAKILGHLRNEMPTFALRSKKELTKQRLLDNLETIYSQVQAGSSTFVSINDFPSLRRMQRKLEEYDFSSFNRPDSNLFKGVETMLQEDLPKLLQDLASEEISHQKTTPLYTGADFTESDGFSAGASQNNWIVSQYRTSYDDTFEQMKDSEDFISHDAARDSLLKSRLPSSVLNRIWMLVDTDVDRRLSKDEFALLNYLVKLKLEGYQLPDRLPEHLIPPSNRGIKI